MLRVRIPLPLEGGTMMSLGRYGIVALSVAGLLAAVAMARGDDEAIKLSDVPAAVRKAADKAAPKATWTGATKETDEGKTIYSLSGTIPVGGEDREVAVDVTAEGKVLEVEVQIPLKSVDPRILGLVKAKYPKFQPEGAASASRAGRLLAYVLSGTMDKKNVVVRVSADFKTIELGEDDGD
jgi:hypothetical protein